jgi:uncharacterized protein with GYD domain
VKRNWFLPQNPDVLGMLGHQAAITCEGMAALIAWANAEPDAAQRVRDLEHRADDAKRELRLALTDAFITPIDSEDIYVMSGRLDAVLIGAKGSVRVAEVRAWSRTRRWRRWRCCWPTGPGSWPPHSDGWTRTGAAARLMVTADRRRAPRTPHRCRTRSEGPRRGWRGPRGRRR